MARSSASLPTRVHPRARAAPPLRVIYCARAASPSAPRHPTPFVCPHACPALALSLRGARLVYLLQYQVIYKIFNKSRIFLTVTAAFLFTWETPSIPPSAGRGGSPGAGKGPTPRGPGGLGRPMPSWPTRLRRTQRNPPKGKVFRLFLIESKSGRGRQNFSLRGRCRPPAGAGDARPKLRCGRGGARSAHAGT